ncbi:MAG: hypothetical protein PHE15_02710 [Dehalococcoidales bacterium]|nr:hypothetical protein [Dehalococcoidales bacterium]
MDRKDLELLEFPRICEIIAGYCSFSLSRDMAMALSPSTDIYVIKTRLEESAEAGQLLEKETSVSMSGVEDIRDIVVAAARGKILDPKTLSIVRTSIRVMRILRSKIIQYPEAMPVLCNIAAGITEFLPIEKAIDRAISPDGEIMPNASTKLVSIRHNQVTKKAALMGTLQTIITTGTQQNYIQEPIITEREGRFVIPVKNEYRREVNGIVHDVSNSGATLFIEPLQAMELGNALKEAQIEERREIERILTELSE